VKRLPKLPPPPTRAGPPPEPSVEIRSVEWAEEPSTARTNETMALFQSLLSIYDRLSQSERKELINLASEWFERPEPERVALLGLISRR
jgi:hypothetical protein